MMGAVARWWRSVQDGADPAGPQPDVDEDELPLARSADQLAERLRVTALAPYAAALAALGRTGIRLLPASDGRAQAGRSRLGGEPDLPEGAQWPRHEGRPLAFLAQVDLGALAAHAAGTVPELPTHGVLAFFLLVADSTAFGLLPEERGTWRVLHHDDPALVPTPAPADLDADFRFRPVPVSVDVDWVPAPDESAAVSDVLGDVDTWQYADAVGGGQEIEEGPPRHRLLGNPDQIQGDVTYEAAERADDGGDDSSWRLLLQLDSDADGTGMEWGDVGRLYWMLREDDLRGARWDRSVVVGQCY